MLTAPALSFIVNGETYLTTKAVDSAAQGYIVTVKSGLNGSVLNVIQTESDGSFTLPAAPSIPSTHLLLTVADSQPAHKKSVRIPQSLLITQVKKS